MIMDPGTCYWRYNAETGRYETDCGEKYRAANEKTVRAIRALFDCHCGRRVAVFGLAPLTGACKCLKK